MSRKNMNNIALLGYPYTIELKFTIGANKNMNPENEKMRKRRLFKCP